MPIIAPLVFLAIGYFIGQKAKQTEIELEKHRR